MKLWWKIAVLLGTMVMALTFALPAFADTHTVQKGDTLWDLYGTRYPQVAAANGISNPDLIFPGQKIRTNVTRSVSRNVGGRSYVVKQGDTLWGLVGTRWPAVARANGLANPDLIYPGQRLTLSGVRRVTTVQVAEVRRRVVAAATGVSCRSSVSSAEQWIFDHESFGGSVTADNPVSTAFGIGQLLDYNREKYGAMIGASPNTTNFCEQLKMFRLYVRDRYGNAENAKAFWISHGWY